MFTRTLLHLVESLISCILSNASLIFVFFPLLLAAVMRNRAGLHSEACVTVMSEKKILEAAGLDHLLFVVRGQCSIKVTVSKRNRAA